MRKLLSIVIPSYNSEKFMKTVLGNLIKVKNLDLLDIIVVDDGSVDNTFKESKFFSDHYSDSIKTISKENGGHGSAINTGIANAVGKYFKVLDAEKQSALHKKICKEEKLQVIFNGVDIKAYENGTHGKVTRADLNIPEDAFVVGMVGRIIPQKAPDVFVRMAKLVKDEVPNAHFVIVGSGNQEAKVRQYAEDNGFEDSLHITGWVNDPMSYVELFDIACLLSRWEGFGLVLPEYMMAEKPIVATCVDAIPNIVRNEENGLLVEVDNAAEASEAVIRLYRNAKFKQNLVIQGIKDVHSKFDAQRVAKEHEKLFEELVR